MPVAALLRSSCAQKFCVICSWSATLVLPPRCSGTLAVSRVCHNVSSRGTAALPVRRASSVKVASSIWIWEHHTHRSARTLHSPRDVPFLPHDDRDRTAHRDPEQDDKITDHAPLSAAVCEPLSSCTLAAACLLAGCCQAACHPMVGWLVGATHPPAGRDQPAPPTRGAYQPHHHPIYLSYRYKCYY